MSRTLPVVESFVGCLLLLAAVVLLANSRLCFFNHASCGMVEPPEALLALALSVPLLVAAWFHRKGKWVASGVAYLPAVALVVFLCGQACRWW
jgi:hypothetical protein